MAAEQRRSLEQLMASESSTGVSGLMDQRVCRSYCVDFCVHDLFVNTKYQIGPCPRIHSEKLRLQYMAQGPIPAFERAFASQISKAAEYGDFRVAELESNLYIDPNQVENIEEVAVQWNDLTNELKARTLEIDALAKNGRVESAISGINDLETIKKNLDQVNSKLDALMTSTVTNAHQKLRVCQICGSYLSELESDERLAHHFTGKLHLGFAKIREAQARLTGSVSQTKASAKS